MNPVVVIGAGGFGRETLDVLDALGWASQVLGVVDREVSHSLLAERGTAHLGSDEEWLGRAHLADFLIGIGDPLLRSRLDRLYQDHGLRAAIAVHPGACVGSGVSMGEGTVICGGAVISPDVALGRHTHVNPHALIGADTQVEDYVSINPMAVVGAQVRVGGRTLIGAGAVVADGVRIGTDCVIGAAAMVCGDVESGVTVAGVPARPLQR